MRVLRGVTRNQPMPNPNNNYLISVGPECFVGDTKEDRKVEATGLPFGNIPVAAQELCESFHSNTAGLLEPAIYNVFYCASPIGQL